MYLLRGAGPSIFNSIHTFRVTVAGERVKSSFRYEKWVSNRMAFATSRTEHCCVQENAAATNSWLVVLEA